MFDEKLLETVSLENYCSVVADIYISNLGLTHTIMLDFGVPENLQDDFKQLAYFALCDAVRVYLLDWQHSLLAYYRRCLLQVSYELKMRQGLPITLTRTANNRIRSGDLVMKFCEYDAMTLPYIDTELLYSERRVLQDELWQYLATVVSSKELDMLRFRFVDNMSLREIGCNTGMNPTKVKRTINRILRYLRGLERMYEFYVDYGLEEGR